MSSLFVCPPQLDRVHWFLVFWEVTLRLHGLVFFVSFSVPLLASSIFGLWKLYLSSWFLHYANLLSRQMWRVSESLVGLLSSFSLYVMDSTSSWMWQCGCWMQCGEVNVLLQLQIVGRCGRTHVGSRRGMKKAWLWGAPAKNGDRRAWKHPNWEFGGDT